MTPEYSVIPPTHSKYPEGLRNLLAGAQLFAVGNVDLLSRQGIGICGSRDASVEALTYAFKFGCEATRQGLVVISGYARGVDRQAHKGALEAGGATIAVLPEGVNAFRLIRQLRPSADLTRNFLAVSMFEPEAVWKSWRAMERNKLIVGLSSGVFVVEARETGGTINAALECVRQGKPLWAIAYSKQMAGREGNRKLLQASAIPLKRQSDLSRALEDAASRPPERVRQLAMSIK